jgi:hypothetical protein
LFDNQGCGPVRLGAADLAVLGRYLYGPRWKAPLARELVVSVRLVKYWASGCRPTSLRCSLLILALVQRRRACRLAQLQQGYSAMVDALGAPHAALAITPEVVPPYLVPRSLPPAKSVASPLAAQYEDRGLVVLAAALRLPAIIAAALALAELI